MHDLQRIKFKQQGSIGRFFDWFFTWFMFLLQGNFKEVPQITHFWNNIKLSKRELSDISNNGVVHTAGSSSVGPRVPYSYLPRMRKGWCEFLVLEPRENKEEIWFVGWSTDDARGISIIPVRGKVRLLLGTGSVWFFGLDSEGSQIPITNIGHGKIGDAGKFSRTPLR